MLPSGDEMAKYWECDDVPIQEILPNFSNFVDLQVGEALKEYVDDLTIFIDYKDGEIILTAFVETNESKDADTIRKRFVLSDLIRRQCMWTGKAGTLHPSELDAKVIGVSSVLKKMAQELDDLAEKIKEANQRTPRDWK